MSYVQSVLQPGERLKLVGHLHWIVYWPAILCLVLAIAIAVFAAPLGPMASYASGVIGLLAICFFLRGWFIRWITEIAVTDRRIIYKRGFIMRHTEEMNMDKVTSVDVDQSILGRMLDYGTVHVIGVGGAVGADTEDRPHDGIEHLHRIAGPLALRNAITAK
jgi:uncharacterized membrane protein YdbT with pleckstrin-like domain